MYRLLILDDEHHIVDWLYELFTEKCDLDLDLLKAYSANEALKILEHNRVDILMSDIRMPGMNGIDLVKKVKSTWMNCKIIFLTGYDEFDYIYSASKQHYVSYLLKTEPDSEIINAVKKAILEIEKDFKNPGVLEREFNTEQFAAYLLRKKLILELIEQPTGSVENTHLLNLKTSYNITYPSILIVGRTNGSLYNKDLILKQQTIFSLELMTQKYLTNESTFILIDYDRYNMIWLLQPQVNDPKQYEKLLLHAKEMLEPYQIACKETLDLEIMFLIYEIALPFQQINNQIKALKSIANHKVVSDSEFMMVLYVSNEESEKYSCLDNFLISSGALIKKVSELKNALEQGHQAEFLNILQDIENKVVNIPSMHFFPALEVYYSLALIYLEYINRSRFFKKLSLSVNLNKLTHIEEFSTWAEVYSYFKMLTQSIFVMQKNEQISKEEELVMRIKSYVRTNICSELTLVRIAENVSYNTSYISRLFKRVEGQNLFEYIYQMKISKAMKLLSATNKTIQDISKELGYDSPQYFSTVFKKKLGVTPHEYRVYNSNQDWQEID